MKALLRTCTLAALWLALAACHKEVAPPSALPASWEKMALPLQLSNTHQLFFLNEHTGWLTGSVREGFKSDNVVLRTSDGGASWQWADLSALHVTHFRSFFALNAQVIFGCASDQSTPLGLPDRPIFKSTDAGQTWQELPSTGLRGSWALHFFDEQVGVSANTDVLQRTTDGGQSWQTVYQTPGLGGLDKLAFPTADTGYAAGGLLFDATDAGTLLKTTDGGHTWQKLSWPYGSISAMGFISPEMGFIGTAMGRVLRTTDGGNNWEVLTTSGPRSAYGAFPTPLNLYLTENGTLWSSDNGGKRWQVDYDLEDTRNDFARVLFPTPTLGFAMDRNTLYRKVIR